MDRAKKPDVQARKRAMDEAPVGITITDPSMEDNPIVYANNGFLDITGYPRDEVIGKNCRFLQGSGTSEEPVRRMREAIDNEKEVTVELRNYKKNGTEFWSRVTISPLYEDGELTQFVGFQEDVTERVERERELRQRKEQVQDQNERLEELRSSISHDIRTPLSVAMGRVKLMQEKGECDEESLKAVERSLDRIDQLIDELLRLARQDRSVEDSDKEPVSIPEIAEECWGNAGSPEAELLVETEITVEAERSRLVRVFENLFRNSTEHGREDITVCVGSLSDRNGFYIEDNGDGISAEERDKAFEKGYSTKENGTGFGLSIVKEIIEAHGWEVFLAESEQGGVRFEIYIPAQN